MNNDDSLDLLDLDDNASVDALPDAPAFAAPRPKKPWLLLGIGVLVIILATYIIVRTIGSDSSSSIDVDLDAPAVVSVDVPGDTIDVPPVAGPQPVTQPAPQPSPAPVPPVAQPAPQPQPMPAAQNDNVGAPVRVIEDRPAVTFNPDKPAPAAKPAPKPKAAQKPAAKPVHKKQVAAANGSWYVQFGSYSTRALAENAQRQFRNAHPGLFQGQQFTILAAVLKNGTTTYRLRIAFASASDANSFCRNAKSDGVDCYVAK